MSAYATLCSHFGKVNLALNPKCHDPRAEIVAIAKVPDFAFLTVARNLTEGMFELEGLDHVALGVQDVERSADWYIEVLGFERRYQGMWNGIPVFIGLGKTAIALFPARNQSKNPSTSRPTAGMLHLALRASRHNFLAAQRELKKRGIEFDFQDHEISHSIYFQDPDGIKLEITTYELT